MKDEPPPDEDFIASLARLKAATVGQIAQDIYSEKSKDTEASTATKNTTRKKLKKDRRGKLY